MYVRGIFVGLAVGVGFLALVAGAVLRHVPSESPIGSVARIFDSLAPAFLVLALATALLLLALRARWLAGVTAVLGVFAVWDFGADHRATSVPLATGAEANLRIVFLNVLGNNLAFSDRIVAAVENAEPDIVVFAEAEGIYPSLGRLQDGFDFTSPCAFEDCQVLVAARRAPDRFWRLSLNPIWPDRYAVTMLKTEGGTPVTVAGAHLVKPWFQGVTEPEFARLAAQYNWISGPLVAVGDFNAAPWSFPVADLLGKTGLKGVRRPIGTWPARLGPFGVPIDTVFVRGGADVVRLAPFGEGLGSNHRGLLIDVFVPSPK